MMRSFFKLAGAVLVASSLVLLNWRPLAAQTLDSNVDVAAVEATCAYCEDYTHQVIEAGEIRTDWRAGIGYVNKRKGSTRDTSAGAAELEISCA